MSTLDPAPRPVAERPAWLAPVLVVLAVLVALGVFALPWLTPTTVKPIFSESQAVGFVNRVAQVSLGIGALVFLAIAWITCARTAPFARTDGTPPKVSRWLVLGAALVAVLVTAVLAAIFRQYPPGDASYLTDRALYLIAGHRPYADFEFSYGPLLLYPQYLLWLVLRPLGVSIYSAYYVVYALASVLGMWLLAVVIDRLQMPRALKHTVFVVVAVFALMNAYMGLNYTLLRFVTHLALLVWVIGLAEKGKRWPAVAAASVLAVVVSVGISPEVGIALLAGLLGVFLLRAIRGERSGWFVLGALGVMTVGIGRLVLGLPRFVGFASGTFAFPVLPGPPAIVYVGSVLVLAWAVGAGLRHRDLGTPSLQFGWFVATILLAAAAFGRADFGHLHWDGLGAYLAAVAILASWRPWLGWAGATGFAATFFGMMALYLVVAVGPYSLERAVNAGGLQYWTARRIAAHVYPDDVVETVAGARPIRFSPRELKQLKALGSFAVTVQVAGPEFAEAAANGSLRSAYAPWNVWADVKLAEGSASKSKVMLVPSASYRALTNLAAESTSAADPPLLDGVALSDPLENLHLFGLPVSIESKYPVLDVRLSLGRYLAAEWEPSGTIDGYTILRRR